MGHTGQGGMVSALSLQPGTLQNLPEVAVRVLCPPSDRRSQSGFPGNVTPSLSQREQLAVPPLCSLANHKLNSPGRLQGGSRRFKLHLWC